MTYPQIAFLLAIANLAIGLFAPAWPQALIGLVVLVVLTLGRDRPLTPTNHRRPHAHTRLR